MNIVFYRYGSIYEPDMIDAFKAAGLTVIEISEEIRDKNITDEKRIELLEHCINKYQPLFVYGINFYPVISELCRIYNVMYLCQTVDSPILTLFSSSIRNKTNRIFVFDRAQYDLFSQYNPECFFHLPLASAVNRFDDVINTINNSDRSRFTCDISFVGSTYREKDGLSKLEGISEYTRGYINALLESCLRIYGYYPVKDSLASRVISEIKEAAGSNFPEMDKLICNMDNYVVSHEYIGNHMAVAERERTLNSLARYFKVDLYTRSDVSALENVHIHPGVRTLDEMPKVFNLSKINLNITMRPIETGLPLRCFDIMGCGGFLMTNYQPEIDDMFVIGKDLECYSSIDELTDKCYYYLKHEDSRSKIAKNGYEAVSRSHTHFHRLKEMLSLIQN